MRPAATNADGTEILRWRSDNAAGAVVVSPEDVDALLGLLLLRIESYSC